MPDFIDSIASEVPLTDDARAALRATGVTSFDQLDSITRAFPSLATVGVNVPRLSNMAVRHLSQAYSQAPASGSAGTNTAPITFGAMHPTSAPWAPGQTVILSSSAHAPAAGAGAAAPVSPPLNVWAKVWPVRDQGARGTCVSFAVTACVEIATAPPNALAPPDLSEQLLYWAIKTKTNDPNPQIDGTYLQFARDALASEGVCDEPDWPYVLHSIPMNPGQGTTGQPSSTAISNALKNKITTATYFTKPGSQSWVQLILNALQTGKPVGVSLPVFQDPLVPHADNWNTGVGQAFGVVINPPPTSHVIGGHAVCITGFAPDVTEPLGGYFIFRNSWDVTWAYNAPSPGNTHSPRPGYGQISATYVDNFLWEMFHI